MDDAAPPGSSTEALAALEAEVVTLRSEAAEVRRDRAAVDEERAALDRERAAFAAERETGPQPAAAAAPIADPPMTPRRVLGTLAHKSTLVRRLRGGRGSRPG